MDFISISDERVLASAPEGETAEVTLAWLMEKLAPAKRDTGNLLLPPGTRAVFSNGPMVVLVHETQPCVRQARWIAPDSPRDFGPGTKYRLVRFALPYMVTFAVFAAQDEQGLQLTKRNELFFRNQPLKSLDEELCFPALLNVSRYDPIDHPEKSLCWVCTANLAREPLLAEPDENKRIRLSLDALLAHLFNGDFNRSSEFHEHSSWFTETVKRNIDPRISTVERWEEESRKDPFFVLDVPWIPTGYSVRQMVQRIFRVFNINHGPIRTSSDVARLVFNQGGEEETHEYPHLLW